MTTPRVVASLTTLPKRLFSIDKVLTSLLEQTYPLSAIYLNVPYKTLKGEEYIFTDELKQFLDENSKIIILRGKDYGPITKILPTLDAEKDPETIIITFDDDVVVKKDVVEILLKKSKEYPTAALSFSGWCRGSFPLYFQIVTRNVQDKEVDWIQGVHSILYKRKFLNRDALLKKDEDEPSYFRKHDDHVLSAYLEKKNIPKISIGYDCKEYFTNLDDVRGLDAISTSKNFALQVAGITKYLSGKGIYKRSSSPSTSLVLRIAAIVAYFLILFFIFRKDLKFVVLLYVLTLALFFITWKDMLDKYF